MNHRLTLSSLAVSALLLSAVPSQAQTYGFDSCVSNNNATNCSTSGQYTFGVSFSEASNEVSFLFMNTGLAASSISEIYLDDGRPLFKSLIVGAESSGVDFVAGADPSNLPAGMDASPNFVATLAAEAIAPPSKNGVNPGEWVQLKLLLDTNRNFADVGTDLASGALRVGIHVIAFANGGSESFITTPVPEPETYAMALVALGVLGVWRRRQARSEQSTV